MEDIWSEREEVTGGWRKVHIAELCDFHCVQNVCVCEGGGERERERARERERESKICTGFR